MHWCYKRSFPSIKPARVPAFLFVVSLSLLSGCSLLKPKDNSDDKAASTDNRILGSREAAKREDDKDSGKDVSAKDKEATKKRDAFDVEVKAPKDISKYLDKNLELQRYRTLDNLHDSELSRLLGAAEKNARDLLATLGYFSPKIDIKLENTPNSKKAPRTVVIAVEPGKQTKIANVNLAFSGQVAEDPSASSQRDKITNDWSLKEGAPFTQSGWDSAKSSGLRALSAHRFPAASIQRSSADINTDTDKAKLAVTYDSGPAYKFGPVIVKGGNKYPKTIATRLGRIPVGADYDEAELLAAQQRLAGSGYYDSVFLTLDTSGPDPLAAPVVVQVRDAPLQKVVFGVGISTDSGPRVSVDHTINQLPWIGWRAVSKLSFDRKTKSIGSTQTAIPDESGWGWATSELLQRELSGTYQVNSGRVRGGRLKTTDHIDRSYYLQYDYANNQGPDAPPSASALSVSYAWTGRYFNSNTAPTRGYGLALEIGPGYTLTGEKSPFLRTYARALGFIPLGEVTSKDGTEARRSRLQLRAEAGAVNARPAAQIPATLEFLTGGDTTVRGYSYRQIGARTVNDKIFAGRFLAVGSVEYQRPIVWNGKLTDFESVLFLDAGAVADHVNQLKAKVGIGTGVRWASPVGPIQADIAYGVDAKALRLHLRLGFTF
jgi:translocation and assembly module TamA